jgi:hypothetical protein
VGREAQARGAAHRGHPLLRLRGRQGGLDRRRARRAGAHGSKGALRAVPRTGDWAVGAEIEEAKGAVFKTDPDLIVEAVVKVDRRSKVVLQVWDLDARENLAHFATVEPGVWTTVTAKLSDFTDPAGEPRGRPVGEGDRASCFTVFAGEGGSKVELLVDDVRFYFAR